MVRRRLFTVAKPERQAAINKAMNEITAATTGQVESRRDFALAQRTVLALQRAGQLSESALLNFAKAFKYEEVVAALAMMTGVKITTLDKLIAGDRYDPILIACRVLGFEWATARALIVMRLGPNRVPSPADIEGARVNFTRLMPSRRRVLEDALGIFRRGESAPRLRRANHSQSPDVAAMLPARRDTASSGSAAC